MKRFALLLIFFLMGFALGKISFCNNSLTETTTTTQAKQKETLEVRQGGYAFINPLLECEIDYENDIIPLNFKQSVQEMINKRIGSQKAMGISFYFRDLNNGPWFGINQDEAFAPASLLKVPLMMTYFKKAEQSPELLGKTIVYQESENSLKANIPEEQQLKSGMRYTVNQLIEHMILLSDNSSFELLSKNISAEEIEKIHKDLGIAVPSEKSADNFISVKEYASLFRVLYNASYLGREMSEKALEILSKTTFDIGIIGGLPNETITANKFGIREYPDNDEKQLHDCGIVYVPNKPYLVCIMTRGTDFEYLSSTIQDISRLVYEEKIK